MRRSNMSNINIKLDVQALQALELLGVKFDIVQDVEPLHVCCQKSSTQKSVPSLALMVEAYIQNEQPSIGVDIFFHQCGKNNAMIAEVPEGYVAQRLYGMDWLNRGPMRYDEFKALAFMNGNLYIGKLNIYNDYQCKSWQLITAIHEVKDDKLEFFLENLQDWYKKKFQFDLTPPQTCNDVLESLQKASSRIDELEIKLKSAQREALNNQHKYENLYVRVKGIEKERDDATELCRRMVDSKSYSGWHAYYAMSYVRDNVAWYIESRSAKGGGADARVNLKEFHHAFDESTYFLTRQSIKDEELILKLKELREEMRNFYAILEEMIITIKYSEGNPKQAVARIIKVLDAIL